MMVRSLVDEVVRRRLWPVVLVALLVIIAAPVLFMKSAPADAPAASDAPPAAAEGSLPARAAHLLTTSDRSATKRRRSQRSGQDPFAPPISQKTETAAKEPAAEKSASAKSSGGSQPQDKPVEVVIKNPDGSTPASPAAPSASNRATKTYNASASDPRLPTVDVRFAERTGGKLLRRVDRLQMFRVGDKPVAVFVKWSPKRRKAVFAIAPTTIVGGDVECRRKEGLCRFVDIPAGKHARLTVVTEDGSLVTRRLDVVRAHRAG